MTALFEPTFDVETFEPVGDWHPARFTDTLTGDDNFTTAGDRLLEALAKFWTTTEGKLILDEWQTWLIRRVLETYPPDWPVPEMRGQLRYKKVLISLARQNGKSVVGAALVFYFLTMHKRGPKVGGFASIESQAKIVYDRVRFAIEKHPVLLKHYNPTLTRGITNRDGTGIYNTFPSKVDSLQGEPFTAALYDELHLGDVGLWNAITIGQRSKRGAMLVGITTAGDDESELLITLYEDAETAINGGDERFGAFIWEAEDDELTEANIIRANPAVACGRIPLAEVMAESVKMWRKPKSRLDVIRYTLNRFIQGTADAWVSAPAFNKLSGDLSTLDLPGDVVWGLERTANWEHAAITANYFLEGRLYSELVATLNSPTHEVLERAARDLSTLGPCAFAMPADTLRPLGKKLRDDGHEAWILAAGEMQQAYATALGAVKAGTLTHAGDPLVRLQSSRAKPRKTEDGSRISKTLSIGDVDAILSMFAGIFVASIRTESSVQFF